MQFKSKIFDIFCGGVSEIVLQTFQP